jgi:ribosomal protein S18 acetylase RimI-like enzyme
MGEPGGAELCGPIRLSGSGEPGGAVGALAAALRRRRAARAPAEARAVAVAALEAAAEAATASASTVLDAVLVQSSEHTASVLDLNHKRLPGKVCSEALATRLQSNRACCFIALAAEDANNVVGFVLCETTRGSVDIVLLAVADHSTRQGIGRMLLFKALVHAAVLGCSSASLSVQLDNTPAICLYNSIGFQLVQGQKESVLLATSATMQWCLC